MGGGSGEREVGAVGVRKSVGRRREGEGRGGQGGKEMRPVGAG